VTARHRPMLWPIAIGGLLVLAMAGTALSAVVGGTTSATGANTLAATAGCGKAPTLRSGTQTIQSSGRSRQYVLRIPDNYNNNNPYRLVFASTG